MTQAFQPCLRLKESPWIRRNRLSGLQVLLQLIFRPLPSVGNRQHVPLETAKKLSWKHQLRGLRSFGRRHEPGSLKTLHLISAAVRNLVIQRCVQQQEMQKKNEFQVKEETKALLENQHHIPGVFRKILPVWVVVLHHLGTVNLLSQNKAPYMVRISGLL